MVRAVKFFSSTRVEPGMRNGPNPHAFSPLASRAGRGSPDSSRRRDFSGADGA
jgi:hypothetical protein